MLQRKTGRPPKFDQSESGPRLIIKYGNRRLYDLRGQHYVTLEWLQQECPDEFEVIDHETGEDLTEVTKLAAMWRVVAGWKR